MSTIRKYGCWAGEPKGTAEDPTRCILEVACGGRSVLFHQCMRKRGHGPNGLYCKQHAKNLTPGQELYSTGLRNT